MFKKYLIASIIVALFVALPQHAEAYSYPSTNQYNIDNDLPNVTQVDAPPGEVSLKFDGEGWRALEYFEYRLDHQILPPDNTHPIVTGDTVYPGICIDGRPNPACDPGPLVVTFQATCVEVRLALGGEGDWRFDWTEFCGEEVPPEVPSSPSGAAEVFMMYVSNPLKVGSTLQICWEAPTGQCSLLSQGVVPDDGTISLVVGYGDFPANDAYGTYQTSAGNVIQIWGIFDAYVDGGLVLRIAVESCNQCLPTMHLIEGDETNLSLRPPHTTVSRAWPQ